MAKTKRQSQVPTINNKHKVPQTSADITKNILSSINQKFVKQLSQGKISVNPIASNIRKKDVFGNPQQYYESIEESLSALRTSILEHKMAQKVDQKVKLMRAQELIERMKKEREQYRQKINEKSKQNILHRRIYSDTVINKMREKLQQRIATKRTEIEERVHAIEQRKKKREQEICAKQIQYKENLKEIRQKAKSSLKLPSLGNSSQKSRVSNLSLRKRSQGKLNLDEKQYESPKSYFKLASLKNESIEFDPIGNSNRLKKLVDGNIQISEKLDELYHIRKGKMMGDEFLKQSLLQIKKNASSSFEPHQPKGSIELQAQEAHLNKNDQIEKLKEKWERMLSKIKHNQIAKQQGLQLLSTIERRLDKINFEGVKDRLRKKYEVLSNGEFTIQQGKGKISIDQH